LKLSGRKEGAGGGEGGGAGGNRGGQFTQGRAKRVPQAPRRWRRRSPGSCPNLGGRGVGRHEIRGDAEKANVCGKRGF